MKTTEPCPNYEEISPITNVTPSAGENVDEIDTVDNQAYAPIENKQLSQSVIYH